MAEIPSSKIIQIHVDDETLSQITREVNQNKKAMVALRERYDKAREALNRGYISSPTSPDDYLIICNIMN